MTTFSQMVDSILAETRRADMRSEIAGYVNATIRELHHDKLSGAAIGFHSNLQELEITADADEGFAWDMTKPHLFQKTEAVYYSNLGKYAIQRYPSSAFAFVDEVDGDVFYYRAGNQFLFSGYGGVDATIKLAWYEYPRRLAYYATALRPAVWSDETESWTYLTAYDSTAELRATALDLTTNWLIQRHRDLIEQGSRAKIWTRLGDKDRAGPAYSQFEALKPSFVNAESSESGVVYGR